MLTKPADLGLAGWLKAPSQKGRAPSQH